jgi:hypothetical protein
MVGPIVIEIRRELEPITADSFIAHHNLDHRAVAPASSATMVSDERVAVAGLRRRGNRRSFITHDGEIPNAAARRAGAVPAAEALS